ncbi:MAG: hypothetical protein QGI95_05125 [Dehalococcoidales bacterium]|jgi:hypothetical protein|nr:hypothetical protein [Dehalococcoidales bacterium]MDP6825484.1 hypothetical protein [Dehalococcoidales bacterium]|tara:strand:+ start:741 stop:863 length:123 start_codon:yes stop_codon:yes gene_type:complete
MRKTGFLVRITLLLSLWFLASYGVAQEQHDGVVADLIKAQ